MKNFCTYKITIFHRYSYVTRTHNAKKHNNRNMLIEKCEKNICRILYFKATLKKQMIFFVAY